VREVAEKTVIASRYRVLRELGRGGMGAVFLAEHVHTGDHVALKLLLGHAAKDPTAVERFKREARASARIKSEHVVKVIDADVAPELDEAPFIVMELLEGCDLEKLLSARGKLAPAETVSLLAQAAVALDKSHAMGIIHRDLKPENLFLHRREDGSETLKIVDFGISKMIEGDVPDSQRAGLTSSGAMMGTPLYMSPEQAKGHVSEIGAATDVWAMGLIALRLLTNDKYWTATSVAELMVQILSDPMPPPTKRWPSLAPAVDAWFARSCARKPAERFASVGEQVAALATALGLPADAVSGRASTPRGSGTTSSAPPLLPIDVTPIGRPPGADTRDVIAHASTLDAVATPPGTPKGRISDKAASVEVLTPTRRSRLRAMVVVGVVAAAGLGVVAAVRVAGPSDTGAITRDAAPAQAQAAASEPGRIASASPIDPTAQADAGGGTATPPSSGATPAASMVSTARPVATTHASSASATASAAPAGSAPPHGSSKPDPRAYNPEAP
jgi:serine/threonine-protein kinase